VAKDKNYVSFWFWIFAIVFAWIPCFGFLFSVICAFAGENESRKNYFKAALALQIFALLLIISFHSMGFLMVAFDALSRWVESLPIFSKSR
jgi:hypothetical protein